MPQRSGQGRAAVAGGVRRGDGRPRTPAIAEKMIRKLRAGMMPPAGREAARRRRARRRWREALETRDRSRGRAQPEARLAPVPAAEPRRVRARGQGPARRRRRRHGAPAGRHDQRRLRQHRRRAGVLADAAGRLSARRRQGHDARARRSRGGRRAKPTTRCRRPRRSCAASTARRSARAAASRSCTRSRPTATTSSAWICTPTPAACCSAAPTTGEKLEVSIDGERVALIDIDPRMTEATTGVTLKTPPIHIARRAAPGLRRVHPAVRGAGGRSAGADRSHAGRHADRRRLRHHDAPAPEGPEHRRAVPHDGRVRDAEPAQGLHLPPDDAGRRSAVRARDRPAAGVAGVPRPGRRATTSRRCCAFYDEGRAERGLRGGHRVGARGDPREPAVPVPARAGAAPRAGRSAAIASAIASWRRGCRSSCGARRRTTSC